MSHRLPMWTHFHDDLSEEDKKIHARY